MKMTAPTARELEDRFLLTRLKDLPREKLLLLRKHSKRMFGNQDRIEVAVAITQVELGRVNATDLNREVDVAVNRIRSQLLALEEMGLLRRAGAENGKRIFERCDRDDPFWAFVVNEYEVVMGKNPDPLDESGLSRDEAARSGT